LIPFSLSDSAVQAPVDALPKDMPMDFIIADVDPQSVNDVMAAVGNIPGIFVFDIGIFDSMINRILNQMAALPLLIAGLSLFAAAALIATTVSLATMERRRQIGILKAIGVKRRRALKQLLIENGIIGVTGGIISLLPTLLILGAVPALTEGFVTLPVPYDLIALMLILAVVITLGATLLTAWSAASEKPLTVLRYE
jgi:putative ABC transport system permease protein